MLPTYPAICALIAAAALDGGAKPRGVLFWIGAVLWAIPALGLPLVFGLAPSVIERELILAPMIGGGLALIALLFAWRWLLKGVWIGFVRASVIGAALLYLTAYQFSFPALSPIWTSQRLAEIAEPYRQCRINLGGSGALASVGYHEPSLVFLAGTDTALIGPEAAAAYLTRDPGALVWVERRRLEQFNEALATAGGAADPIAETTGFQYNGGKARAFTLFAHAGPAKPTRCPNAAGDDGENGT